MSLASLRNKKVNILRITKTPNVGGLGGWKEVKNVLHLNLPCRINWKRGTEKIFSSKGTYFRDGKLYCKVVDITTKDIILYNDTEYEIVDVNDVDEKGKYLVLDLKLIK